MDNQIQISGIKATESTVRTFRLHNSELSFIQSIAEREGVSTNHVLRQILVSAMDNITTKAIGESQITH